MANNSKQIINKINIIEREGKYYNLTIINNNEGYELFLDEVNKDNSGLVKDTDIFLWGLFLPNTKKTVKVNKSGFIEQCVFKKGLLTVKAEIDFK